MDLQKCSMIIQRITKIITMYNQTQLIMISRRLFPNKNIFNLNKQEQSKVIEEYERTN